MYFHVRLIGIEEILLVAPSGPTRTLLAREEIDIRAFAIRFDAAIELVRLAAMLTPESED